MSDSPKSFTQAVFKSRGSELVIEKTKWVTPQPGQVVIHVQACGINSTDYISQYNLIDDTQQKFPVCPGMCVAAEICEIGEGGEQGGKWKKGDKVGALMRNGGLGEFAVTDINSLVKLDDSLDPAEACLLLFNCSKLAASYRNNVYNKEDLVVIHGEGGYARLAIDVYQKLFNHNKLCLCTSDSKSSPSDYGLQKEQFLLVGKDDLGNLYAQWVLLALSSVSVDPPEKHIEDLFSGCKDDARIILLVPSERALHIPTGELVQRGISLNGSPYASPQVMEETIKASKVKGVKLDIERYPFTDKGVKGAWTHMERERRWEAPVVVFGATH
ncbi:hypothetical protein JCM5353_005748 [Sporobolomyces roseus]